MPVKLQLRLLGTFDAMLDGVPMERFRSAKVRALLAYLGVEAGRIHLREHLATLLWGEYPQSEAQQSLSQALTNLRNLLGTGSATEQPLLKITRQTVQLNSNTDQLWVDVHAFDLSIASVNTRHSSVLEEKNVIGCLEEAVALYLGPFLNGFSLPDNREFEEWLMLERERRHQAMQLALTRLISHHMVEGHMGMVEEYARQQLALEPWNENGHQMLMLALALEGQRTAALQQYETCRNILAEELGVEPSDETNALLRQIRSGVLVQPAAANITPRPPFVGRELELTKLDHWLDRSLAGFGRVVMVVGEAGTGKTALLSRFAQHAQQNHHRIVVAGGRCSAYAGLGDPLLPFREILQALICETQGDWLAGGNPEYVRRLVALFPQAAEALVTEGSNLVGRLVSAKKLAERIQTLVPGDAPWLPLLSQYLEQSQVGLSNTRTQEVAPLQQEVLFEQVTQVFQAIAGRQPLLLLIDDLQWADAASLSLLFHLGQHLTGSRIMLLGAYRPSEITTSLQLISTQGETKRHMLEGMLNEFSRLWGDIWVDLDQTDGRRFVDALLDGEPNRLPERFRDELTRHTGGQALFTIELLRSFMERGALTQDEDGRWVEGPDLFWEGLPPKIEAVIAERLGRLPSVGQRLLEVASVEGEFFNAEVLANAMNVKPAVALKWLSGPLSREYRLVKAVGMEPLSTGNKPLSRYRFTHALFQEFLYVHLDPVDRAHLHKRVGDSLVGIFGSEEAALARKSPQLAQHYEEANIPARAASYYLKAGRWAVRLTAYDEAIAHFKHGLALLENFSPSRESLVLELGFYTAMTTPVMMRQGLNSEAYTRALTRLSDLVQNPVLQDSPQRLAALTVLALSAGWSADPMRTEQVGRQLLDLVPLIGSEDDQIVDHQTHLLGHWALGFSYWLKGQPFSAMEHLDHAVSINNPDAYRSLGGSLVGDPGVMARAMLGAVQWQLGYPNQARASLRKAVGQAEALNQPSSVVFAHYIAAMTTSIVGRDRDAALSHAKILHPLGQISVVYRAWADMLTGQAQVECAQSSSIGVKSRAHEDMARVVEAGSAWQAAGSGGGYAALMLLQAEVCAGVGQVEMALSAIDQAQTWIERTGMRAAEAEVWRMRGELLLRSKDQRQPKADGQQATSLVYHSSLITEAEACFQRALSIARKQQARIFELRTALRLSRLWESQGKREEAKVLLSNIYDWFSEGFDTIDLIEAKMLLDELG